MSRILIADDDPAQLDVHKKLLEALGHEVALAQDAEQTERHVARDWPDLLILDLRMPVSSVGLALIRRVREMGCSKPVIVLSGWPDELYGRPEEKMVSRVLIKPAPVRELQAVIQALA